MTGRTRHHAGMAPKRRLHVPLTARLPNAAASVHGHGSHTPGVVARDRAPDHQAGRAVAADAASGDGPGGARPVRRTDVEPRRPRVRQRPAGVGSPLFVNVTSSLLLAVASAVEVRTGVGRVSAARTCLDSARRCRRGRHPAGSRAGACRTPSTRWRSCCRRWPESAGWWR
jgi:hypothetical protein